MSREYLKFNNNNKMSFTDISIELQKEDIYLTPARTRTIVFNSIEKIIKDVNKMCNFNINKEQIREIVKNPEIQNLFLPILEQCYSSLNDKD